MSGVQLAGKPRISSFTGTGLFTVVNDADGAEQVRQMPVDDAREVLVGPHETATSGAHDASAVSVTPTGLIVATNVQNALAELERGKLVPDPTGQPAGHAVVTDGSGGLTLSDLASHSTLHDDMRDEIVAIWAELGVSPSGSSATVAARLDALPRGQMGVAARTAGSASIGTTVTDLTGLSVEFTGVAGRRYLALAHAMLVKTSGAAGQTVNLFLRSGSGTQLALSQIPARGVGDAHTHTIILPVTTAGATTLKLSANTSAGTMTLSASATNPASLTVFDIGLA